MDLSATPFFLRGSGYAEGTLFPWTMSDFSLMDAIECGIVKLPRVPVADNIPGGEMPMFRNLWEHIRTKMPKKGRGKAGTLDPLSLPPLLITRWKRSTATMKRPSRSGQTRRPRSACFIVVCNNTSISSWFTTTSPASIRENEDGSTTLENGRLALFRNFDEHGNPPPGPTHC
jgi:type III restriction enzyme